MKQNNVIKSNGYSDPVLEKSIREHTLAANSCMEVTGKDDALNSLPQEEGHWRVRVFNYIEAQSKSMLDVVQQKLLPVATMKMLEEVERVALQKLQKLKGDISALRVKQTICQQELKSMKSGWLKVVAFWIVFVLSFLFGVFDGFITYDTILNAGMGERVALMYGSVIAIVIGGGSHFGAGWVRRARTWYWQVIRFASLALAVGILFYWVGDMRATYIMSNIDIRLDQVDAIKITGIEVSGITIGGISLFIFLAGLCFSLCVHRTKTEIEQHRVYRSKLKEVCLLAEQIRQFQSEQQVVEAQRLMELQRINQVCEYAVALKKRIHDIARECLCLYANTNLSYRTDGHCPHFFSNPPQFNF